MFLAEEHQIDEIQKIIHKLDITDQIVKIISIETITLEQSNRIIYSKMIVIGTVIIQTLGMDTIPRTVLQTIEIEIIQLVEIETIDHKLVQQWTILEKI